MRRPKPLEWDEQQHSCHIYAIGNPINNMIRYIGMSSDVECRFYQHLHGLSGGEGIPRWIEKLQRSGLCPTMKVLETINTEDNAS